MNAHADKAQESRSQSGISGKAQQQGNGEAALQFEDHRSETITQRRLQGMADDTPQGSQSIAFQDMADHSPQAKQAMQLQARANDYSAKQQPSIQKKENNTGLPDDLKSGIESLSGYAMDDVKVHYNSSKPAQLHAHAYAQGSDIHIGSGQENHLPHEAWHVVQQKQGRVNPTRQMKGKVNVNDDAGLEKEADVMGVKAASLGLTATHTEGMNTPGGTKQLRSASAQGVVQRDALSKNTLNVIGEEHGESGARRDLERVYSAKETGSDNYAQEGEFRREDTHRADPSGLRFMYMWSRAEAQGLGAELTEENCTLAAVKEQLEANQGLIAATGMCKGYFTLNSSLGMNWEGEVTRAQSANDPHRVAAQEIKDLLDLHLTPFINAIAPHQERLHAYYDEGYTPDVDEELSSDESVEEPLIPLDSGAYHSEEELDQALNPIVAHGQGLLAAYQRYKQAKMEHGLGNEQHVANQRSKAMHAQANERSGVLGVWKIGDMHRRQMERMGEKQYNLVGRDAFNSMLVAFDKNVGTLIGATTGAIIGGIVGGPLGAFLGGVAGGLFGRVAGYFVGKYRKGVKNGTLGGEDTPEDWT